MVSTNRIPWYRAGFIGAMVLGACTLVKFLVSIPRLFTEHWTWRELLWLPLLVTTVGFVCGSVAGLMLPLSRRFGMWGDAAIGAVCGPAYLFLCLAMCEPTAFQVKYVAWGGFLVVMSAMIGGSLAVSVGQDFRTTQPRQEEGGHES